MKFNRFMQMACVSLFIFAIAIGCKKKGSEGVDENTVEEVDTPISGNLEILVEESIFPIVDDVANVFQYEYSRVHLDLKVKSEQEILKLLYADSLRVAILPRSLTTAEQGAFEGRVKPKMTEFATDAIVFVASKKYKDSIIDYDKVVSNLKQNQVDTKAQGFLVFDHYTSSVSSQFREAVGKDKFPKEYAYFLGDTNAVIKYVETNPDAIGVIGLNWLSQSDSEVSAIKDNLKVLGVKNSNDGKYYKPSQNNIAEGTYPLTRKLYIIDLQGKSGLGLGFGSYLAGKGQRIILKSGLVPVKVPPREILVRKEL